MKKQYVRQLHDHGIFCADAQCVAVYRADDADKRIADLTNEIELLNGVVEDKEARLGARIQELERLLREAHWIAFEDFPKKPAAEITINECVATPRYLKYWQDLNKALGL